MVCEVPMLNSASVLCWGYYTAFQLATFPSGAFLELGLSFPKGNQQSGSWYESRAIRDGLTQPSRDKGRPWAG